MNELTLIDQQEKALALQERQFEFMQRQAKMLAASNFVPDQFRNNVADCALIWEMANRLKTDAILVSREIHFIHNKPGFSAKFSLSMLNKSGLIKGRLQFKKTGKAGTDSEGCYAYAFDAQTGNLVEGPEITIGMAKAEGWTGRNGSKWKTLPALMLQYRAVTFFINTLYPEVMQGYQTVEELADIGPQEREVTGETLREKFRGGDAQPDKADDTEESQTVTVGGAVVDAQTGEVLGQAEIDTESPSFKTLKNKLKNARSAEETAAVAASPLMKKCTSSEAELILKMIENGGAVSDYAQRETAQ